MAFLQQEDADSAFEAALSFVDSFALGEADIEVPSTSDVDTSRCEEAESESSREAKRRRRAEMNEKKRHLRKAGVYGDPNRVRNERTREIAFLREQVVKLQIDLQVLRLQDEHSSTQPATATTACEPETTLVTATSSQITTWQDLAKRQKRRREEAETKNVRLRLTLDRHRKLARALRNLMQKRARQLANECASFVDLDCLKDYTIRALDYREDNCEFIRLFQHLDATYREIDTVFQANGLAGMAVAPSDVHMREGANGKFLEFFSYKDLPFRLRDTSEATWEHFRGVEKHLGYGNLYEKAAKDLDQPFTIVEDFTKELYSDTSRADIRVKQVLRRYQESDRDVIVFTYRAVPAQIKHKLLSGLTYHLRGYAVTKKSPVSTPGQEQTLLQLCTLVSLDPDGVPFRLDACSFRALTNFLIVHTAQNMRAHRELIENALIDQVTRRLQ